jgi:hypothetical protein
MSSALRIGVAQSFSGEAKPRHGYVGRIFDITPGRPRAARAARRDVIIPVGDQTLDVDVAPGRYVVEALLPSGEVLEDEVEVARGQVKPVEFAERASPHEWLGWQTATDNLDRVLRGGAQDRLEAAQVAARRRRLAALALAEADSEAISFSPRDMGGVAMASPRGAFPKGDAARWIVILGAVAAVAGALILAVVLLSPRSPPSVPTAFPASPPAAVLKGLELLVWLLIGAGVVSGLGPVIAGYLSRASKASTQLGGVALRAMGALEKVAAIAEATAIPPTSLHDERYGFSEPPAVQAHLVITPNGHGVWSALSRAFERPDGFLDRPARRPGAFQVTPLVPDARDDRFTAFHLTGADPGDDLSIRPFPAQFCLARGVAGRGELMALPIPWRSTYGGPLAVVDVVSVSTKDGEARLAGTVQDPQLGTYLGYLASGRLAEARAVIDQALELLFAKYENPFAAAAGGYVLISAATARKDEPWREWVANLSRSFPWLPDGAVLHAWSLMASDDDEDIDRAREAFLEAYRRGLPVFAEGVRRLRNGLAMFLGEDPTGEIKAALTVVEAVAERCNAQQVFTCIRLGR